MAHEEAAGMNLDDLFFRRSNIDPDAIYEPNVTGEPQENGDQK